MELKRRQVTSQRISESRDEYLVVMFAVVSANFVIFVPEGLGFESNESNLISATDVVQK